MTRAKPPIDVDGRRICLGDWVRVTQVPQAVRDLPRAIINVFRAAVGKTFQVEAFDDRGYTELKLGPKVPGLHTIWVEPHFLKISHCPAHYSKRFCESLESYRRVYGRYPRGTSRERM